MWKLNNTLLDNQWVKEEITREIRKYHEINENENISELCKTAKAVPRGKLIALNTHSKSEDTHHDGYYKKKKSLARMWRNWNPCELLVGT